jgi:hypothetical protein
MDAIVEVPRRKKGEDDNADGEEMQGGVIKLNGGVMEEIEKNKVLQVVDIPPEGVPHEAGGL